MNLNSPSKNTIVSNILTLTLLVNLFGAYNFRNNNPKSFSYINYTGLIVRSKLLVGDAFLNSQALQSQE